MPKKKTPIKLRCSHRDTSAQSNNLVSKFTNKEKTRKYEKWHCNICEKSFII